MDTKWVPNRTFFCMCFRSRFWNFSKALLLKIYISIDVVKMSFLMQNHVFYRSFLIWQMRMKALQSGADDNKNGFQNRPQIDEKWSHNWFQNRSFFQWLRRRLSASILERFGTILGSMLRRFWSQKSIQKHLERTSKK